MNVDVRGVLAALGIEVRDRGGGDLWGCCPHPGHEEKEASWHISEESGVQHCFGCGREGDSVDLVASVIGCTIGGALEWLREKKLDREGTPPLNLVVVVSRQAKRFKLPVGVRNGDLETWPTPVRRYALSRGITAEQVRRWRIGYAIEGRLANRLVFPVYTRGGEVISYTGRTFANETPRYKMPHISENPSPAAIFGEEHWRGEELTLTEGAINALAFERIGVESIGALSGSDVSREQLLKIKAQFKRIVIASDADGAGEKIAAQLLAAFGRWCALARANFPPKKDAQDLRPEDLKRVLHVARHSDWPALPDRP